MSKEHGNMGRKSLKAQDAHKVQHMQDLEGQLPIDQPTRPSINPDKATKSSKPNYEERS